jgi:zinc protease
MEILMEPRWDEVEFTRLKQALETSIKGRESSARSIAYVAFAKLLYGDNHIFSIPNTGTLESTEDLSMEDMKAYYQNIVPKKASFHVVGDVAAPRVKKALTIFDVWSGNEAIVPKYSLPEDPLKDEIYFVDVPGAKQSVLYIGKIALSVEDKDANKLDFSNEILGVGSSGRLTQVLRIEKGYTYGAFSFVIKKKEKSPFIIGSSVRSNATLPSLEIIKEIVENYAQDFGDAEVEITKNKILKDNTRAYESYAAKLNMLKNMSKYNKKANFIEEEQKELIAMTLEEYRVIIDKYLKETDLVYVIVGDKETQFEEIIKFGKKITELDRKGNLVVN